MQQLFLVILESATANAVVQEANGLPLIQDSILLTDRSLLIQSHLSNPQLVGDMLRISEKADSPQVGLVFRLSGSYSGYFYPHVWEWLAAKRSESSVA